MQKAVDDVDIEPVAVGAYVKFTVVIVEDHR
jgi:hypothetical protein